MMAAMLAWGQGFPAWGQDRPSPVIKNGKQFLVMDQQGLVARDNKTGGLYRDDTRYLKTWDIRLNGETPTLLQANTDEGYAARFIYANNKSSDPAYKEVEEQSIMLKRDSVI